MHNKINKSLTGIHPEFDTCSPDFSSAKIPPDDVAYIALEIGERIQISGGEIGRVEDTVRRICIAYGAKRVDVFAIMSLIVLSIDFDGINVTHTRRITPGTGTNLYRLEKLNNLSRRICRECPTKERLVLELDLIYKGTESNTLQKLFGYAFTAMGFTVFFGGTLVDGLCSGITALLAFMIVKLMSRPSINKLIAEFSVCFVGGAVSILFSRSGFYCNADMLMIGNIMYVIPGLSLTNSLRDLIGGDLMTGVFRLTEVLMDAVVIACGYALAIFLLGAS